MEKEKQSIINNTELPDSSSKLIFGDNILSSQFFRDYADMEILRNIQPEDIEDVSERYVPLYSTERESDTVKKVNISKYLPRKENQLNLPLYIISLIEHKTKVEYNVVMQILRYMVYIWEDYEKEMTRQDSSRGSAVGRISGIRRYCRSYIMRGRGNGRHHWISLRGFCVGNCSENICRIFDISLLCFAITATKTFWKREMKFLWQC